jgi:hypothetical protein
MAFLTIAGVNYDVQQQGAGEATPRLIGKDVAAFAGGLRTTRRARKRVYNFTLAPLSVTAYETLITNVATSVVSVTGDALDGAAISALVDVNSGAFIDDLTAVRFHQRIAQITVREV